MTRAKAFKVCCMACSRVLDAPTARRSAQRHELVEIRKRDGMERGRLMYEFGRPATTPDRGDAETVVLACRCGEEYQIPRELYIARRLDAEQRGFRKIFLGPADRSART